MNRTYLILTLTLAGAGAMFAQERERGPRGGFARVNPLIGAIDTDHDGVLSADEISKAATALKTLDKNGDGKLTEDELRPNFGPGGPGGPGARGGGPGDMVRNLMRFDKNGDGKLTKDEVPERMQGLFDRADANKDGVLTEDELQRMAQAPGGPGRPGGFRRADPVFAALDADHDGVISAEEIANAATALKTLDKSNDGKLTEDEFRPRFGPRRGEGNPDK